LERFSLRVTNPAMPALRSILWILTTQWRAQALGYAGDPNARTPWLDALAAQSQNYLAAVTPHPFGPFARAAILTGVPSPENGVAEYFDALPRAAQTAAHHFRARGYSTAAYIGKWHLSRRDPAAPLIGEAHARAVVAPEDRGGFDYWEGFESGFLLNDPWLHGGGQPEPRQYAGYQSDVLADRAQRWMAAAPSGAPWFCVVSLEPPHPPYAAPAAGIAPPSPESLILPANVPRGGEIEARARRELAGYYAQIEATDRALGRLFAAVPPDVRVVFTSVHGDMHGAHGLFRKGWPHEESIRVPLLIRDPDLPAARITRPVSLLHLRELSLDPAAIPPGPVLSSMPSVVGLPDQCDRVWRAVRTEARKWVYGASGEPWLGFDLAADPGETKNLAPGIAGESPPPFPSA
jgi:arylsulfatase A-like enzyme